MHILLLEPNALLGKAYQAALQNVGHKVTVARHAQTAIRGAERVIPDVVVLELQLPGHSGVEFLYEFRSYPEWQYIPVVLHTWVTMHDLEAQRQQFDALGIVEHLYKPATNLTRLVRVLASSTIVEAG